MRDEKTKPLFFLYIRNIVILINFAIVNLYIIQVFLIQDKIDSA